LALASEVNAKHLTCDAKAKANNLTQWPRPKTTYEAKAEGSTSEA